jgi:transcriptional regulator with XRE-family HTH domain
MDTEWGTKLKELRKEKGLTQSELAVKSGLNRGHIAQIETDMIKVANLDTYQKLAAGLDMQIDDFLKRIGENPDKISENPEQILERLRLATPMSVSVYTDFPFHAGRVAEPHDTIYVARARAARKGVEAYIVHGNCLSPSIEDGDYIVIDRERQIDIGDIVACLYQGELHLGKLKKIAGDSFLENSHGQIKIENCQLAAPVIEVVRRLK